MITKTLIKSVVACNGYSSRPLASVSESDDHNHVPSSQILSMQATVDEWRDLNTCIVHQFAEPTAESSWVDNTASSRALCRLG